MNATDLDLIVPEDRSVKLKGRTYIVPGDMPMETYLRVNLAAQQDDENADEVEIMLSMKGAIMDLFLTHVDRDTDEGKAIVVELDDVLMSLGVRTITQILGAIYNPQAEETPEDVIEAEDPTPAAPGSTMTTT